MELLSNIFRVDAREDSPAAQDAELETVPNAARADRTYLLSSLAAEAATAGPLPGLFRYELSHTSTKVWWIRNSRRTHLADYYYHFVFIF